MRKMILAVGAAGVVMTGAVSLAPGRTLTGSQLSGVGLLEYTTRYFGGYIFRGHYYTFEPRQRQRRQLSPIQ